MEEREKRGGEIKEGKRGKMRGRGNKRQKGGENKWLYLGNAKKMDEKGAGIKEERGEEEGRRKK